MKGRGNVVNPYVGDLSCTVLGKKIPQSRASPGFLNRERVREGRKETRVIERE